MLAKLGAAGTFGVPFYLFAALYFQARSFARKPQMPLHHYLLRRIKRLYVPMVAWTFIYLLARNIKHHYFTHVDPVRWNVSLLWTGSAHHLWFLPMLMIVTIAAAILNRGCARRPRLRNLVIIVSAIIGTYMSVCPRPDWLNYVPDNEGYFFLQSWKALPSVFLGLSLAWWLALGRDGALFSPAVGFAGILLTCAMVSNQTLYGYSRVERTMSGMGWLMVALTAWWAPWVSVLARLGRHAYGIYLVHVLVIETIQAIAHHAGYGSSIQLDLFTMTSTFLLSSAVAVSLSRIPSLRWLNGE
jgi:peptidoglycan/LPS O-acetylase OafA/YrhL